MKATSMSPRSGQRTAGGNAVVLLHGHQLDRNLARAVTAEAAGTFVLVLAITSAAVAATLSRPVAGAPRRGLLRNSENSAPGSLTKRKRPFWGPH